MNDQNAKIIERVRQLLAMAADKSSPHEAAIAAGRARKLMDQHQLSETDLKDEKTGFSFMKAGQSYRFMPMWKDWLSVAVARFNDCQSIKSHEYKVSNKSYSYRIMFRGFETDVIVATAMYDYLCAAIDRLCSVYIAELGYDRYPAKLGDAYKKAASRTIVDRLSNMQEEREQQFISVTSASAGAGTSLVIFKMAQVNAEFGEAKYVSKAPAIRHKGEDVARAMHRGHADGKDIPLNTQIGPSNSGTAKLD